MSDARPDPGCCDDRRAGSPRGCTEASCMKLPSGITCSSCVHEYRCTSIFGAKPADTVCQFFPRRFHPESPTP